MKIAASPTLTDRWKKSGPYAATEFATAVLALLIFVTPLIQHINSPALWVLADFSGGMFIFMFLMARDSAFGRLYAGLMVICLLFLCVWLLADGLIALPVLTVYYIVRGWWSVQRAQAWLDDEIPGDESAPTAPVTPMDEVVRVTTAVMLAGIPAVIAYAWFPGSIATELILTMLFFCCSGWFYLYPVMEWIYSYQPPVR